MNSSAAAPELDNGLEQLLHWLHGNVHDIVQNHVRLSGRVALHPSVEGISCGRM